MFRSALLNYHQTSFLLRLPLKWGPTLFLSHRGTPAFSPTFRSVCALWKAQQGFYGFCCSNLQSHHKAQCWETSRWQTDGQIDRPIRQYERSLCDDYSELRDQSWLPVLLSVLTFSSSQYLNKIPAIVIPQLAQSAVQLRAAEKCVFFSFCVFLSNISATCRYFNFVRIIILMNLLIVFVKRST